MGDVELLGARSKFPKWQDVGRGGIIIASVSFSRLPWPPLDVGGHPLFGLKMGDVELLRKRGKRPKWTKIGRRDKNIGSPSLRHIPWTPVVCLGGRWRMGNY